MPHICVYPSSQVYVSTYVACCHGLGLQYLTLGTNISGEDCKVPEAASLRYGRMAAVRVMGCDWRHRRIDEALLEADLAGGQARMREEYLFECEGGLVCGAGSQVWHGASGRHLADI